MSIWKTILPTPVPPGKTHHKLMVYRVVVKENLPGVCPVSIGGNLRRLLAKLDLRVASDQENIACGNLKLFTGSESGIEGSTHAVGATWKRRHRQILLQRLRLEWDMPPVGGCRSKRVGRRKGIWYC